MYLESIFIKYENIQAAEKYFIVKLLQYLNDETSLTKPVKFMVDEFGIHARVVSSSIRYLIKQDYCVESKIKKTRGRSLTKLTVQPKLIELINDCQSLNVKYHRTLIDDLLCTDPLCRDIETSKQHPLTLSCRLLLIVLLSYADKCGVVRGLGEAMLCQLTGMKKARLKSEVTKLKDLGYIRSSVSGLNGIHFLGTVNTVYFLNLANTRYRNTGYSGAVILFPVNMFKSHEASNLITLGVKARKMKDEISDSCNAPLNPIFYEFRHYKPFYDDRLDIDIRELSQFFGTKLTKTPGTYLQLKISEYASYLLSTHWKTLIGSRVFHCEYLMSQIRLEALATRYTSREERGSTHEDEQIELLYEMIFSLAIELALTIKSALEPIESKVQFKFEDMDFVILPTGLKGGISAINYPSIELHSKNMNDKLTGFYLLNELFEHIEDEDVGMIKKVSLSVEEQYKYGLLTRPNPKKEKYLQKIKNLEVF